MKTNNLKTMLLMVAAFVVIAAGLTFLGGVKGDDPAGEQQFTANEEISACPADCDKSCCKEKDDAKKCPPDCDKPCCKKPSISCCGF